MIKFLVDTGALGSSISEKEATLMGIDIDSLPYFKGESVGFGGSFKPKIINRPVTLTFESGKDSKKIRYDSGFKVTVVPPNTDPEERKKLLQYMPSVLGMDILYKFRTCIDERTVELTYEG